MTRDVLRVTRRLSLAAVAAGVGVLGFSPGAQAEVRVGENYRLASDASAFRGKDQVALAVNPNNAQHIVEVNEEKLTQECEGTRSLDGGVTWSTAVVLKTPVPAAGSTDLLFAPTCSMFQSLAFGSGQNVYATSSTPRTTGATNQGNSALVYKSTDGGLTWQTGTVAMAGGPLSTGPTAGPSYQRPALVVDRGAGANGADRVYVTARESSGAGNRGLTPACPTASCQSIRAAVSNDGGQTFSAGVNASPPGVSTTEASQPVLGRDALSVAWRTLGTGPNPDPATVGTTPFVNVPAGLLQVARSTDQAQTFRAPVNITQVTAKGLQPGSHVTPAPQTGSTYPRLAADRRNDNVYIVYGQGDPPGPTAPAGGYQGADHFIAPDSQVYFQRSVNKGATWAAPKKINDPTTFPGTPIVQTRHPDVNVAPNGRVDVVWQDRRHWYQGPGERDCLHTHIACDDARLGDTYYSYSTDGGSTFSPNRRISDQSQNNDVGYDYRLGGYWDYGPQSVAIGDDKVLIGWMDSREGSSDSDNLDTYLAKVDLGATGAAPQATIDKPDAVSRSVALSVRAYPGGNEGLLSGTFATRNGTRVVIVNQDDTAGALAAGVLARANLATVLLSPAGGLPASVKAEVSRLNPDGAYIIGDTSKLSAQVQTDLAATGILSAQITRLAGDGDAGTAAAIATQMDKRLPAEKDLANPAFDAAVIANPAGPDAGAASGLAAARRLPILYVSADAVPAATTAALTALKITKTLVIGGTGQVSDAVKGGLPSATRLGGGDQYATSKAVVAESLARGLPGNVVYAADGVKPMDAALLGPVVGRTTGVMMLAPAPLTASVPSQAAAFGLNATDQFILLDTTVPPGPGPGPGPSPPPGPGPVTPPKPVFVCGPFSLLNPNVSKTSTRVEARVRIKCSGTLTARATTKLRAKGKLRTVRLATTVKRVGRTGNIRAIRVTLSGAARSQVRRAGKLKVTIKVKFVPRVTSAKSATSTRTVRVTVRKAKAKKRR